MEIRKEIFTCALGLCNKNIKNHFNKAAKMVTIHEKEMWIQILKGMSKGAKLRFPKDYEDTCKFICLDQIDFQR